MRAVLRSGVWSVGGHRRAGGEVESCDVWSMRAETQQSRAADQATAQVSVIGYAVGYSLGQGIETLGRQVCHMVNLEELDLSGNQLSALPAPLATSLRRLRRLHLGHNAFTRLPQARLGRRAAHLAPWPPRRTPRALAAAPRTSQQLRRRRPEPLTRYERVARSYAAGCAGPRDAQGRRAALSESKAGPAKGGAHAPR